MQVKECELVFRYHIYFNKEESDILRLWGWVHPLSKDETDMWFTEKEIENLKTEFPALAPAVERALEQAKELAEEARKKAP